MEASSATSSTKGVLDAPSQNIQLHVIVLGAGIGGLTASLALRRQGHSVQVFEQSPLSHEAGAAIHVVPNANGSLLSLGVDVSRSGANLLNRTRVLKATGEVLSTIDNEKTAHRWQHPWRLTHRGHLHHHLFKVATSDQGQGLPIQVRTGCKVASVDPHEASITLTDGTRFAADVLIGADGVHSVARTAVDASIAAEKSKHSAFRLLISRELALKTPETQEVFTSLGSMDMWYGPDRKIVLYPCSDDRLLNLVCVHPAELSSTSDSYLKKGNRSTLLDIYRSFDPIVLGLLEKADPETLKVYRLYDMVPLPSYVNDRLALIGDAAHPFLPHLAQGGAMAIEDGVSIGVMLSNVRSTDEVPARLQLYNEARYERTCLLQKYTRITGGDGVAEDEHTDSKLALHDFLEYGMSYDAGHASADILRQHRYKQNPNHCYWPRISSLGPTSMLHPELDCSPVLSTPADVSGMTASVRFRTSATLLRNMFPSAAFLFSSKDTVAYASFTVHTAGPLNGTPGDSHSNLGFYIHGMEYRTIDGELVTGSYQPIVFTSHVEKGVSNGEELHCRHVHSDIAVKQRGDFFNATLSSQGAVFAEMDWPRPVSGANGLESKEDGGTWTPKYNSKTGNGDKSQVAARCVAIEPHTEPNQRRTEILQSYTDVRAGTSLKFFALPLESRGSPELQNIVERLAEMPYFDDAVAVSVKEG